jgi:predicted MPP superfamily phosphohydrolase
MIVSVHEEALEEDAMSLVLIQLADNVGTITFNHNARCPRQFRAGAWQHHQLIGYTSVGAGVSIVDARLNCRPEITLHHIRMA